MRCSPWILLCAAISLIASPLVRRPLPSAADAEQIQHLDRANAEAVTTAPGQRLTPPRLGPVQGAGHLACLAVRPELPSAFPVGLQQRRDPLQHAPTYLTTSEPHRSRAPPAPTA